MDAAFVAVLEHGAREADAGDQPLHHTTRVVCSNSQKLSISDCSVLRMICNADMACLTFPR